MDTVSISMTTVPQSFPATQTFGGYKYVVEDQVQVVNDTTAVFTNVPVGTHPWGIQAVDTAGVGFGPLLSGYVTLDAPTTITLNMPSAATVTPS